MKKINVEIEVPDGKYCSEKNMCNFFYFQNFTGDNICILYHSYLEVDEDKTLILKCKECLNK